MRDCRIVLEPFSVITMIRCTIDKGFNDHARMQFCGRVSAQTEESLLSTDFETTAVSLKSYDEHGHSCTLFVGMVQQMDLQTDGDTRVLNLECISGSYFMDIHKHTRVFQNAGATYAGILRYLNARYSQAGAVLSSGEGSVIGGLLVQYQETDWEFLKRLASHFHTGVCPAATEIGAKYSFGIPDSGKRVNLPDNYTVSRELTEDLLKDAGSLSFSAEQGALVLRMTDREIYEIGDWVLWNGQKFSICEIHSEFVGDEFLHHYTLRDKAGLYRARRDNHAIIGASLEASITAISNDQVQVKIHADGMQDSCGWFAYSTVYSSPDGTGWYCMPEISDSVRLYFPTEKEKHGYVISAVHVSDGGGRSNPDNKSLRSKYGKEVLFTPGSITVTNNNGMAVVLNDEEGISILSDKQISISSKEEIQIACSEQSIHLVGPEGILFEQGDTKLELTDRVVMDGSRVQLE